MKTKLYYYAPRSLTKDELETIHTELLWLGANNDHQHVDPSIKRLRTKITFQILRLFKRFLFPFLKERFGTWALRVRLDEFTIILYSEYGIAKHDLRFAQIVGHNDHLDGLYSIDIITGLDGIKLAQDEFEMLSKLKSMLNVDNKAAPKRIQKMRNRIEVLEERLKKLKSERNEQ